MTVSSAGMFLENFSSSPQAKLKPRQRPNIVQASRRITLQDAIKQQQQKKKNAAANSQHRSNLTEQQKAEMC